jgi:hypothetical protein
VGEVVGEAGAAGRGEGGAGCSGGQKDERQNEGQERTRGKSRRTELFLLPPCFLCYLEQSMRPVYPLDGAKDWENKNDGRESEKEMKNQKWRNDALA